jgi:trk system potassium uptake protein TrkA
VRIIVVGAGEVGTYVADRLSKQEHDVALIEIDGARYRAVDQKLDVQILQGSGTDPAMLEMAGVREADLLVAVTKSDEVNLVSALLARQFGVDKTIVRIESNRLRSPEIDALFEGAEDHLVIDPDREVAEEVLRLMEYPGALDLVQMAGGEVVVLGARLPGHAPLVGVSLKALGRELEPDWDFIVASITRTEEGAEAEATIIPREDVILREGDLLRVVCKRRALRDVTQRLGLARDMPTRALLLGGGRTAELLAESLIKRGLDVGMIERRPERADELSARLDRAVVYKGDITDAELLEEADIAEQDVVIALTGEDHANVLACLYAKSAGATRARRRGDDKEGPETIAVIHRLELLDLLEAQQVDATVSPRTATANSVLRFMRGGGDSVAAVATFLHGDVEVLEFAVSDDSACNGATVADLDIPKGALVGAIVRDGKPQIARGRSTLRDRDHVVVIARPDSVDRVTALFG